jgi:arylsulfatase A-like enzyme
VGFNGNKIIKTPNLDQLAAQGIRFVRFLMDRVVPFIRAAAKARQPFLAVVWFHTPHAPVVAGPQYRALYSQYSEGEQHYYGAITAMDEQVGRMCRELRELGVADSTMLWFASDNGPEGRTADAGRNRGSTGGLRGRKRSLFCGGVTVPGLLVWPGHARPGRVVETPCSTLDYFATLMEILGWKWPKKPRPLDGISLLPLIDEKLSERPVPIPFRYIQGEQAMFGSPTMAMEENQYKLLTNFSDDGREDMLFDLRRNPYEKNNIISEKPEIARDHEGAAARVARIVPQELRGRRLRWPLHSRGKVPRPDRLVAVRRRERAEEE